MNFVICAQAQHTGVGMRYEETRLAMTLSKGIAGTENLCLLP